MHLVTYGPAENLANSVSFPGIYLAVNEQITVWMSFQNIASAPQPTFYVREPSLSTDIRSLEAEVVAGACCGDFCGNRRGATIHAFSHTAVNNLGLIGVGGRDRRSFLFAA